MIMSFLEPLKMSTSTKRWAKRLGGAALLGASAWFLDHLLKRHYTGKERADELHRTRTDDDVRIGLWRHLPENDGTGSPVLLVHGLGVNHHHMDLDRSFSLARYLSENGYDAWCVVLRGRGVSDAPKASWTFDDYAQRDIPAAIDYILEETGHSQLHWVGHSMGGMLYYAVAGAVDYQDKIGSAVSIGGPFHGRRNGGGKKDSTKYPFGSNIGGYSAVFVPFLELLRRLRFPWPVTARWGSVAYSGLKTFVPRQLLQIMVNPENIADHILRKAAVRDIVRVPAGVLGQFIEWGLERHWIDGSGKLDYRKAVSDITVPSLLIAGTADNMVPVHNKRSGFEQLGSEDKELVLAGKEQGFSADYSHVDLVYGHNAREEIFPLVTEWLEDHPVET
jgi:pimeloyl-ACP methyl ester carboxylesterase